MSGAPHTIRLVMAGLLVLLASLPGLAQTFNSGSNGSDGALNLTTPGTIDFDPTTFVPPLNPSGNNVFHFTTINIGAGVTVRLSTQHFNGPVYWLAQGAVTINGILDLNGDNGHGCTVGQPNPALRRPALGGAGGFNGGVGGWVTGPLSAQPGSGPGGGAGSGVTPGSGTSGTLTANQFLIPIIGGSGGGGGTTPSTTACFGPGGGGGGGAIVIASSVSITVTSPGTIRAAGGTGSAVFDNTCCNRTGGNGAGGAIRLMAPLIQGNGTLNAGSNGRLRIEAYQQSFTGVVTPTAILGSPSLLIPPTSAPPSIRVVSVAGVTLPASPGGSFTIPDATINQTTPATINIQASNVPLGTVLTLFISSETGPDFTVTTSPLSGTLASSTATASATFPSGFSRGYIRATW